ncbi:unnamed protein product, partial [Tetraodon nigroviridis]
MGGQLGLPPRHPRRPRRPRPRPRRKFSAACSFGPILVNQERLNINAATEEELMTLPGVGRAVAQNIVEYRDRIGGFRKVEDLALVSGVGATKLEAVKPEICVSSRTSSSQHSPASLRRDPDLHPCTGVNINTATPAQLMSIRGITEKVAASIVAFRAHTARSGAWRTWSGIKLLAVQDLLEREALDKFCAELNRGDSGQPAALGAAPRPLDLCGVGGAHRPPQQGSQLLWLPVGQSVRCGPEGRRRPGASGCQRQRQRGPPSPVPGSLLGESRFGPITDLPSVRRELLFGPGVTHLSVQIGSLELAVVNVHAQEPASGAERHALSRSLQEALRGEEELVVLGDFGGPRGSELDVLRKEKFCPLLPPTRFTDISTRSPQGSRCLDNIWLSRSLRKLFSGHCLVVREGLTHPWIPDNWSWGGVASDHCPVVAEIY